MQMDNDLESRLRQLTEFFLAENAKVNLSAFRTEEKCWIGNVLDSLAAFDLVSSASNIVAIGTGGGFPLLPLAIALPEVRFTGIDSTQKKIDAIARIVPSLRFGGRNLELLCGRAEDLGRHFRETFDVATARAVAEINVLLEYCSPFVKVDGKIILWKSMDVDQELKESERAQKEFRCSLKERHVYELQGDFGKRQLLVFEKTGKLSSKYPRAVGVAKKNPIR